MSRFNPAPNPSPDEFLRDVAEHEMTVLRSDGVYRHLRFGKPGTRNQQFDLITWPGSLCYIGDMGAFVFERTTDMLEFFRPGERAQEAPFKWLDMNYWAEKLQAADRGDGFTEFDPDAFERAITVERRRLLVKLGRHMSAEDRKELWESLESIKVSHRDGEASAIVGVQDWSHCYLSSKSDHAEYARIDTSDFPCCLRATYRFVWCCYALRWAVMLYDATNAKASSPEAVTV